MLTHARTVSKRRRGSLVRTLTVCLPLVLNGCSYLETQFQRTPAPDDRIQIGLQERRHLSHREIPQYRCEAGYFLRCERAGSITLSCTCELR